MKWLMVNKLQPTKMREAKNEKAGRALQTRGWKRVTPAALGHKLNAVRGGMGLGHRQFYEFLVARVPGLRVSRRRLSQLLRGDEASLGVEEFLQLCHATHQTTQSMALGRNKTPRRPWKVWDYRNNPRIRHRLRAYVVTCYFDGMDLEVEWEAYDKHHARATFKGEYPDYQVLDVRVDKGD